MGREYPNYCKTSPPWGRVGVWTHSRRLLLENSWGLWNVPSKNWKTEETKGYNWASNANGIKLWTAPGNKGNPVKLLFFCKYINHSFNIYWKTIKGGAKSRSFGVRHTWNQALVRPLLTCENLGKLQASLNPSFNDYNGTHLIRLCGLNRIMHMMYLALFWYR